MYKRQELGRALFERGDVEEAVRSLKRSVELSEHPESGLYLAMALQASGHADEALTWYRRALDWISSSEDDYETLRTRAEDALGIAGE